MKRRYNIMSNLWKCLRYCLGIPTSLWEAQKKKWEILCNPIHEIWKVGTPLLSANDTPRWGTLFHVSQRDGEWAVHWGSYAGPHACKADRVSQALNFSHYSLSPQKPPSAALWKITAQFVPGHLTRLTTMNRSPYKDQAMPRVFE